jgi:hypothetical protein
MKDSLIAYMNPVVPVQMVPHLTVAIFRITFMYILYLLRYGLVFKLMVALRMPQPLVVGRFRNMRNVT